MPVYAVERSLKGISMDQLAAAQQAAIRTSKDVTAEGHPVRYIRSTFMPESGDCICLFEAESGSDVRDVNDRAQIPYDRVVEAYDLTP